MRIGLSTAAFYSRLNTEDAAERIASLGIPCAEVFLQTFSEYNAGFGALVRSRLGAVDAVSVHTMSTHYDAGLIARSERQRDDAFAMLGSVLDTAQAFGARIFVYHGLWNIDAGKPRFALWREHIAKAIALCANRGIRFTWETVHWCWLNEPARIDEFAALWPDIGFTLDTKQVMKLGHRLTDYVDRMGDRLSHVHVLDFDANGRFALPGRGAHDFRDFARALRANGYKGDVILEPYGGAVGQDREIVESIDWLRDVFQAQ